MFRLGRPFRPTIIRAGKKMDGGAGVGGDRITHPAGPLWPKILWATLHADWCGEKDKIRRENYLKKGQFYGPWALEKLPGRLLL